MPGIPEACSASLSGTHQVLDEQVITGSRMPHTLWNSARDLSVITREDIESLPAKDLADLLNSVCGVDVRQRGFNGVQSDLSIRGGGNEQVLILLDGVNMSDAQTGHHNMDLPVNLEDIERIEILRGSGARTYGHNAMAGVVNIITRIPEQPSITARSAYGSHAYYSLSGDVNGNTGNLSNRISLSRRATDGHLEDEPTGSRINTAAYRGRINQAGHDLRFGLGITDKDFGAYQFYTDVYPDQWENTQTLLASAHDRFAAFGTDLEANAFFRRHEDDFHMVIGSSLFTNQHKNHSSGLSLLTRFESRLGLSALGAEAAFEDIASSNLGDHDRQRRGFILEHQVEALDLLTLGMGTSVMHYTGRGWESWPGADLTLAVSDHVNLFASAEKSFRVPTYTELYYVTPANQGNPGLKPEKAWTWETGFRGQTRGFSGRVSVFLRDSENAVDWTRSSAAESWQAGNIAEINTRGLETGLEMYPGVCFNRLHGTFISLAYSMLDSDRNAKSRESKYALDYLVHQAKCRVDMAWPGRWTQSVLLRVEKRVHKDWYTVADTRLSRQWRRFKVFLDVTNLFNENYISSGFAPQPGRWIILGLQTRMNFF